MAEHAQRTEDYVYNIPAPPRIILPALPAGDSIHGSIELGLSNIFPPALAKTQLGQFGSAASTTWSYEKRQQPQHILPYMLLGPMTVTRNAEWLRDEGITMALGVRQGSSKILDASLNRCQNLSIDTHSISLSEAHSLVPSYPSTTLLITNHLTQNVQNTGSPGKVLVFCESGNERSAAVVAAFIMATHDGVDHIKAMQICQLKRFCCNFNETIKRSLQIYWDILCAQRCSNFDRGITTLGDEAMTESKSRKRRTRDEDMDVMNGGDAMETGSEEPRSQMAAPFSDKLHDFG